MGTPALRDPRCTGRLQGRRATVRCRWCKRRFPVWTKTSTGKRRTWHTQVRRHVEEQHPIEANSVRDPLLLVVANHA
jgi:hypothetical protein